MIEYLKLLAFACLLASGQVAFKYAAIDIKARLAASQGIWAFVSFPLIGALALYAVATGLWIWILMSTPLSKAYPFALLGAVIVPIASVLLFGERLSLTYPVGLLLVCVGVYLCVR